MDILFAGTPDFAVPSLKVLNKAKELNIKAVITQPDRKRGRGKKVKYTPVKKEAVRHNIKVLQPKNINKKESIEEIKQLNPDLIVVVAYGQILSKELLNIPKFGCINLHASLLPKYRGSSPIQQAIIDGKEKTGVTTMYMDEGLDTGDIVCQKEVKISDDDNAGKLHDKLALIGSKLLKQTLIDLKNGNIQRKKQDNSLSSYTGQLNKQDGLIDWNKSSNYLKNFIRAMNPWPSSFTYLDNKLLKIFKVEIINENTDKKTGTIIKSDPKEGLIVQTGDGLLKINELQLAGKKRMNSADFLRGYEIENKVFLSSKRSD